MLFSFPTIDLSLSKALLEALKAGSELRSAHNNLPLLTIFTGISSTAIIEVLKAITNNNALVIESCIKKEGLPLYVRSTVKQKLC